MLCGIFMLSSGLLLDVVLHPWLPLPGHLVAVPLQPCESLLFQNLRLGFFLCHADVGCQLPVSNACSLASRPSGETARLGLLRGPPGAI